MGSPRRWGALTEMFGSGGSNPPNPNQPNSPNLVNNIPKNAYSTTDDGPFFVFVEKKESVKYLLNPDGQEYIVNDDTPLSQIANSSEIKTKFINKSIHPILFGKLIFQKLKIFNHSILGITSLNKHKIRVEFQSASDANKFTNDKNLKELGFDAYIPLFLNTRIGIIRNCPKEIEVEELLDNDVCISPFKITRAERLQRMIRSDDGTSTLVPTNSIKITFASQSLPSYIILHMVKTEVSAYIPRPIICNSCLRYGHKLSGCRSKRRCPACSSLEHEIALCPNSGRPKCAHCEGEHLSTDTKNCPEYQIQSKIKELMTLKNYSFKEAMSIVKYKPYLDAISIIPPPPLVYDSKNFPSLNNSSTHTKSVPQKRNSSDYENENNQKKHHKVRYPRERRSPPPKQSPNFTLPNSHINISTSPLNPNPYRPNAKSNEETNTHMDTTDNYLTGLRGNMSDNLVNKNNNSPKVDILNNNPNEIIQINKQF